MRRLCGSMLVLLALVAAAALHGETADTSFFGRAVTATGALWYTEYDTIRTKDGRTEIATRYVAADGRPMADLSATTAVARYLPTTHLVDHRDNYSYAIEPLPERGVVRLTQQLGGGVSEQRTIALRDDLMTFQGVLLFIVDRRVDLQHGQTLTAQWIVPSRMTSYGLRIYKRALLGNLLTVRLELSSVAFRFFSTPSDLTIDVASGRVLEFAGPSNLLDDKDKPVRVRIVYEYP